MKERAKIIQNAMKCTKCGTIINSRHTHDYVVCGCDNHVMVDGGLDYIRRSAVDNQEDLSLTTDDDFQTIKNKLLWGTYGKDGNDKFKWVRLINCEKDHLLAILENVTNISLIHRRVIKDILKFMV